jgi:hypothetical protein
MNEQNEFQRWHEIAAKQKYDVLDTQLGGYETHPHILYRELLPEFIKRYGRKKGRDMALVLGYLHASKVGDAEKAGLPVELEGWVIQRNKTIADTLGMKEQTFNEIRSALIREGLLVVKKRPFNGNEKLYYLPLYYPNPSAKQASNIDVD